MTAVPYGLELPSDRAPHYWAIACATCPQGWPEFDDLKMVDGVLKCAWCRGETPRSRWLMNPHAQTAAHAWIEDSPATHMGRPEV